MNKKRNENITVDKWIDTHMEFIYNKKIRIIDSKTNKGVGDMMIFYMDREVKNVKLTSRFLFIFI